MAALQVIPAVDLKGGRCVRLRRGDPAQETVFADDPLAVAERWVAEGARWLHVVDLDGALRGRPVHGEVIASLCRTIEVPVQVGGGLRDRAAIDSLLALGAARVVLGTVALRDETLVAEVCRAHPGRVLVALDTRGGRVAIRGWQEDLGLDALAVARRAAEIGAAGIVHTDVSRDGTEAGVDLTPVERLLEAVSVPVIAAGGVGTVEDLRALARLAGRGLWGVIVGRALYSGAIRLPEALAVAG